VAVRKHRASATVPNARQLVQLQRMSYGPAAAASSQISLKHCICPRVSECETRVAYYAPVLGTSAGLDIRLRHSPSSPRSRLTSYIKRNIEICSAPSLPLNMSAGDVLCPNL
jgi:hypothetical protein